MRVSEVMTYLEGRAPLDLQEDYDNAGLITGSPDSLVTGVLVCLDCTEDVLDEAESLGCNMVVAHHPIVFSGMKKLTGRNYVERTVIAAIRKGISIYSIHTNLDNVRRGVNMAFAERLGLQNLRTLKPAEGKLAQVVVHVPAENADDVRNAMFAAGAGAIGNYDECSFNLEGTGSFRPLAEANPFSGKSGVRSTGPEVRIETIVPAYKVNQVYQAIRGAHPYEEIAWNATPLLNANQDIGSGAIGELAEPMRTDDFLNLLKKVMNCGVVRYTKPHRDKFRRIAICGGSGSFLVQDAIRAGADVFVSADFKYHQFFDADNRILIADIGHYESEQFTIELLHTWLSENFRTFATHKTGVVTNPINYL